MRTVRACSRRLSFGLLVSRSASLACARSWSGGTAEQLGSHGIRPVSGPKIAGCSGTDRCRERVLDHPVRYDLTLGRIFAVIVVGFWALG